MSNDGNSWAKEVLSIEESLNRSTVSKTDDAGGFKIAFRDISHPTKHELPNNYGRDEKRYCKVEFLISRGHQDFVVPIFIETDSVNALDYMKEATHRLHLDLARLAEQTAHFKLRDEDAPPDDDRPEERDLSEFL